MTDISKELETWRNAKKGKDVRDAQIALSEKLNNGKLENNLGEENAGKTLVIGPDGTVGPGETGGGSGGEGSYTLPQAAENTLGGVKAADKGPNDTVPAKIGDDGKLYVPKYPESLPASDVKDWAKAEKKPKYTAKEVGALPSDTQIPEELPNPHKLKFTGGVTGEYDGSKEVTITIPQSSGGGDYTLPQASADTLGGIKADPATEEDTVPARIGEDGKLYVKSYPEGGGNADNGVPAGGSTGQMLVKKSNEDNDTEWKTPLTAAEVAEVVMENYLEIIDSINGEAVYTTEALEADLDTVNGEVI